MSYNDNGVSRRNVLKTAGASVATIGAGVSRPRNPTIRSKSTSGSSPRAAGKWRSTPRPRWFGPSRSTL
ncbi:twin-arginine translocation signal domain-containing protein [Halorussus caseinilyticus]|uniref:Twin-arginine translocation signal domain-containing protein n=1 Tax=Halorussus caseinilyticus TaxID=3034025 RepID=A0ABD5WLT5_9EURY